MSENHVRLRVSMPAKVVLDDTVDMVILRTVNGDMGVLPNHEPASVELVNGPLKVRKNGEYTVALTVAGGFASVRDGSVNIMTPIADTPERIRRAINEIIEERERNRQHEQAANLESNRAEAALRQILIRREGSVYTILNDRMIKRAKDAKDAKDAKARKKQKKI